MADFLKDALDIKEQIDGHVNETVFGEAQAFLELPNGRNLEVTHEEEGLPEKEQFYSWRVNCSEDEFSNEKYHGTVGIVDQTRSEDLSEETCINLLKWVYRVAMSM